MLSGQERIVLDHRGWSEASSAFQFLFYLDKWKELHSVFFFFYDPRFLPVIQTLDEDNDISDSDDNGNAAVAAVVGRNDDHTHDSDVNHWWNFIVTI